jgi:hypothetical protein
MATFIGQGTIRRQGITTYQYGEFVLIHPDRHIICAMRDGQVKLAEWVGQYVKIEGSTIPGYPIDGGPEYVEIHVCEEVPTAKSVGA